MRQARYSPSLVSSALITSSKSVPSPSLFAAMISLFNSKTEIPVPSKAILEGSFWDLNRKKTEEDMNVKVMRIVWMNSEARTGALAQQMPHDRTEDDGSWSTAAVSRGYFSSTTAWK